MHGLFAPIVIIGLMVHVSVFIVVTGCECHIELKGYLLGPPTKQESLTNANVKRATAVHV